MAAKLIGLQTGCQFFKNVIFFDNTPLNAMAYLRDGWSFLGTGFVGQCEVFVCLEFVIFFSLAAKLIGPQTGVNSLKTSIFLTTLPLKHSLLD